jgi:hypothetical protein
MRCRKSSSSCALSWIRPVITSTHVWLNQVSLLLWKDVRVNWTRNLYRFLYKSAMQVGLLSTLYLAPFLFNYYNHYNTLTRLEKDQYTQALAEVQELLAQGKTLDPKAPELDLVNQSELPLQPVQRGYTIGVPPQRYAQMRHIGEETSQPGGSRRSTPEPRSPSLPPSSPPSQRDSPMTVDSDAEDRNSDKANKPSVPSSTKGKKRRPNP